MRKRSIFKNIWIREHFCSIAALIPRRVESMQIVQTIDIKCGFAPWTLQTMEVHEINRTDDDIE